MTNPPPLTVCISTYNHVNYIHQAIDSVLEQQTNFEYLLLIGDDGSNDGTMEKVLERKLEFPGKIEVLSGDRNDVVFINGKATGRANFIRLLTNSKSKYIAYLDGDDFWTDKYKLQKQFDFLEANSGFSIVTHQVQAVYEDGSPNENYACSFSDTQQPFKLRDALLGTPCHPSSFFFKSFDLCEDKAFYELLRSPGGDNILMLMLLSKGEGMLLRDLMSSYRFHDGGVWSSKSNLRKSFEAIQFQFVSRHLFAHNLIDFIYCTLAIGKSSARTLIYAIWPRFGAGEIGKLVKVQNIVSTPQLLLSLGLGILALPLVVLLSLIRTLRKRE